MRAVYKTDISLEVLRGESGKRFETPPVTSTLVLISI